MLRVMLSLRCVRSLSDNQRNRVTLGSVHQTSRSSADPCDQHTTGVGSKLHVFPPQPALLDLCRPETGCSHPHTPLLESQKPTSAPRGLSLSDGCPNERKSPLNTASLKMLDKHLIQQYGHLILRGIHNKGAKQNDKLFHVSKSTTHTRGQNRPAMREADVYRTEHINNPR